MIATVDRLVELVCDSQVLNAPQVEQLTQGLKPRFPAPYPLGKEMVRLGWLTDYQLRQIAKGQGQELVLGPYVVLEPVGQGCMGLVFKARHRSTGRLVAVKVIRQERRGDMNALRRFRREVQALTQLSHPNIVTACDVTEIGVAHYYAMELIDGTNLDRIIARTGPMPIGPACDYLRQAALGLQHAHERGLIHRDIKPSNLLVTQAGAATELLAHGPNGAPQDDHTRLGRWGVVKIGDLGLVLLENPDAFMDSQGQLTSDGFSLGTVDYMAPEQVVNPHGVDIRADLYSLGCIFYEMLTGQLPFPLASMFDKLQAHRVCQPRPIQQLRPQIPTPVAAVAERLLAKKPADRFQQPGDLARALTDILVKLDRPSLGLDWQPPLSELPEDLEPAPRGSAATPSRGSTERWLQALLIGLIVFFLTALLLYKFL